VKKYEVPNNSKGENGSPTGEMGETVSFTVQVFREAGERKRSGDLLSPDRTTGQHTHSERKLCFG
jgi:hypothetical protein